MIYKHFLHTCRPFNLGLQSCNAPPKSVLIVLERLNHTFLNKPDNRGVASGFVLAPIERQLVSTHQGLAAR